MPVIRCPNGKYRVGNGPCMYTTKPAAERAYAAYRAQLHSATTELLAVAKAGKEKTGPGPGWWGPPKGTHATAYGPAKNNVQTAGKIADGRIARYCEKRGLSPGAVERQCLRNAKTLTARPLCCRQSVEGAASIVDHGRFKTQYETGTSGGHFDLEYRRKAENRGLGVPSDIDSKKHPVYGYFDTPGHEASAYGPVEFQFKGSVKDRTTVTFSDSMGAFHRGELVGRPANNPTKECWGAINIEDLHRQGKTSGSYVEAQIHGGVFLRDVAKVVFHRDAFDSRGNLRPELRAARATLRDREVRIEYDRGAD